MPAANEDVASALEELSALYHAMGDRHRQIAYDRAAASVRGAPVRLTRDTEVAELDRLPNVGESVASKIHELLATGRIAKLDELRKGFPREFARIVSVKGVGPKLAKRFHEALGVETLEDLENAARDGRLLKVDGVSERLRARILSEAEKLRAGPRERVLLSRAEPIARSLVAFVRRQPGVVRAEVGGSIRRGKPTIGDVDLVAAADTAEARAAVARAFEQAPGATEVLQRGEHTRIALASGIEADLWVVEPEGWGSALSFATGSREHTLELRRRAVRKGWSVKTARVVDEHERDLPADTEERFYETLGLSWIAPELRENRGEIEAAERDELPRLVTLADLKGDCHVHTDASDGSASLDVMVEAAYDAGREWVAITDHGLGLPVPQGMGPDELDARLAAVAESKLPIPVLVGAEANILESGDLGLPVATLEKLDLVIGSVHSGLRGERARITQRIVDALSTGLVDVLGHPTNRRMPRRGESDIDFERVFEAAEHHDVALEIDGAPERMDLPGALVKRAKEAGCAFTIDSDAHHARELEANLPLALACARRGWLAREDVLTARGFEGFQAWLAGRP